MTTRIARAVLGAAVGLIALGFVLPLVLVVVPMWCVVAWTRRLSELLRSRPVQWPELVDFDPDVGWRLRPNIQADVVDRNADSFRVHIDASGWRGRRTLDEADVVVFGDSFAFGHGVDERAFFANLLRDVRIKAIGVPGYSMVQPLLWMERLASRLEGKLVVWLVYVGNDLDDNLRPGMAHYRQPFVRTVDGAWEIATEHMGPSPWPFPWRHSGVEGLVEICRGGHRARRVFGACEYLIGRAREACDRVGARLVVMTIPELSPDARRAMRRFLRAGSDMAEIDEGLPDRRIAEICGRLGVGFVPLSEHLDTGDYREYDFHWNPRGHGRVADVIRRLHAVDAGGRATASATVRPGADPGRRFVRQGAAAR